MTNDLLEENVQKMREAERKLLETGFSPEQWQYIKEFIAYGSVSSMGLYDQLKAGKLKL